MSLIVLASTTSFTINEHFCGDALMDVSVFSSSKSCNMDLNETFNLPDCSKNKKGCCTDEHINVQGQDELQLSFNELTLNQQVFVASFVYSYINLFVGLDKRATSYKQYRPPLVIKPIYKLNETYLI